MRKGDKYMQHQYVDLLIDALLDEGFSLEEARKLIKLQEEYEEKKASEITYRHLFVRWLVEQGRLSDW
jgi:DNA-binding transcriptional MerR regulator